MERDSCGFWVCSRCGHSPLKTRSRGAAFPTPLALMFVPPVGGASPIHFSCPVVLPSAVWPRSSHAYLHFYALPSTSCDLESSTAARTASTPRASCTGVWRAALYLMRWPSHGPCRPDPRRQVAGGIAHERQGHVGNVELHRVPKIPPDSSLINELRWTLLEGAWVSWCCFQTRCRALLGVSGCRDGWWIESARSKAGIGLD